MLLLNILYPGGGDHGNKHMGTRYVQAVYEVCKKLALHTFSVYYVAPYLLCVLCGCMSVYCVGLYSLCTTWVQHCLLGVLCVCCI